MPSFELYLSDVLERAELPDFVASSDAVALFMHVMVGSLYDAAGPLLTPEFEPRTVPDSQEILASAVGNEVPHLLDEFCRLSPSDLTGIAVLAVRQAFSRTGVRRELTGDEARYTAGLCVGAALLLWHTDSVALLALLHQLEANEDTTEVAAFTAPPDGWSPLWPDLGPAAVATVFSMLAGDDPCLSTPDHRGVCWTAGRLPVTITAGSPIRYDGEPAVRVRVMVKVLLDCQATVTETGSLMAKLNLNPVGGTFVRDGITGELQFIVAATLVAGQFAEQAAELVYYASLGIDKAENIADWVREEGGSGVTPDVREPLRAERPTPHALIGFVDREHTNHGQAACPVQSSDELLQIGARYCSSPYLSFGASTLEVSVEVAFGAGNTTLIQTNSDRLHPLLGGGVFITMVVALSGSESECALASWKIQLAELYAAPCRTMFGAWTSFKRPDATYVAFRQFIPNVACGEGGVTDAVADAVARAEWVHHLTFPGTPLGDARPIWEARRVRTGGEVPFELRNRD